MPKTIAVIDGNSLMHRAFHAVPATMNAPDGTPTNAVFGFMSMFLKFCEVAKPDGIVCAFDAGRPAVRMKALETYKAQRPPMDPALKAQFPVIESLLEAMSVPVVRVQGWEGDDVLGTIAARDEALGFDTLLVSGDKDVYQLVTDHTRVLTTKKGITDIAIYGPAEVEERYGVTPAQFPDFLGLKGDSSDNIPGVPGIGDKSAAKLLQSYGSIDGIYENLDKLKGKQLENLENNKEAAFISRDVATIHQDLEFDLDLESVAFPAFDVDTVKEAFGAVRFNAHLAKVLALGGGDGATAASSALELSNDILTGKEATERLNAELARDTRMGIAFATAAQETLFGGGLQLLVGCGDAALRFDDDEALDVLARIVSEGSFVALDAKEALQKVYPADGALEARIDAEALHAARFFDIGLAAYLLNSGTQSYAYDALCEEYLAANLPESEDPAQTAAYQALAALRLADALTQELESDGSLSVYEDIDAPLVSTLVEMERVGARIDTDALAAMGETVGAEITMLREEIHDLAGEEFNVDSPKQLGHILFEVLGLPAGKKTQRGYSTDAKTLHKLENKHPIAAKVLRYRELAKMKSTYIDALPPMRKGDGLVHTSFNQTVTTTGRLSSSDPNLQNIPVRTDFGRRIRECFVPLRDGDVFMSADYSQIELRLLAHLSGDEHLIDAFCSGADFHSATAAHVFGVPVEEVTPQLRSRAKAVNFGIVYGQQAFGLAQSLGIGYKEAQDMIDRYFEAYPQVRAFLDETIEQARENGFAVTMYGRKRRIPELHSTNKIQREFGERTAMNHPMQGSAADIIKLAMNEVEHRLAQDGFVAKLMLQVHDELDFSVPVDEVEAVSAMVAEVMNGAASLKVPLLAEVSVGENWAQAH